LVGIALALGILWVLTATVWGRKVGFGLLWLMAALAIYISGATTDAGASKTALIFVIPAALHALWIACGWMTKKNVCPR
jgi:hypothetical protein